MKGGQLVGGLLLGLVAGAVAGKMYENRRIKKVLLASMTPEQQALLGANYKKSKPGQPLKLHSWIPR